MYYSQKFISVINVFRDDDMKDEIKNIKIWSIYKTCYHIAWSVEKIQKIKTQNMKRQS